MISHEAVEAAARGIFALDQGHHMDRAELEAAWERLPSETERDDYRYAARAALEAAAPYMQRTVTTVEELNALPVGAVILDPAGLSLHKNEFAGWRASNGAKNIPADMLEQESLPATVLHTPIPHRSQS